MQPLWKLSVVTNSEAADAVVELLTAQFGRLACSFTDIETGVATVSTFLSTRPDWPGTARPRLRAQLEHIKSCGLEIAPARITLTCLKPKDWGDAWKRHFQPLDLGPRLLIKPSWSRRRRQRGQAVLILDPGLSFGTGQHPTTRFCLEQIVTCRRPGSPQSFLDVGTGSGILALAAARLGYTSVQALDSDGEALKIARANARRNGLARKIIFRRQDLASLSRRPPEKYALVCANLISNLLLAHAEGLVTRIEPGGRLVLAGILKSEFEQVRAAYEKCRLRLLSSRTENEWRSAIFQFRNF